jgi:RNA polymerase primary sigma factor
MVDLSKQSANPTPKGIKQYEDSILDFLFENLPDVPSKRIAQEKEKSNGIGDSNDTVTEESAVDDSKRASAASSWHFNGTPWLEKIIAETPLLPIEEERALIQHYQSEGDSALTSRDLMLATYYRHAHSAAQKFSNSEFRQFGGIEVEDLFQEAVLGLIISLEKYDVYYGYRFYAYAQYRVRQMMTKAADELSRTVRLPLNQIALMRKIEKSCRIYEEEFGKNPTIEYVAEDLEIEYFDVVFMMIIPNKEVSLDKEVEKLDWELESNYDNEFNYLINNDTDVRIEDLITEDEIYGDNSLCVSAHPIWQLEISNLHDKIADDNVMDPYEKVEKEDLRNKIKNVFDTLEEREAEIINLYFGIDEIEPMTLEEIGEKMVLTRERIRQLKERALSKLRHPSRYDWLKQFAAD